MIPLYFIIENRKRTIKKMNILHVYLYFKVYNYKKKIIAMNLCYKITSSIFVIHERTVIHMITLRIPKLL